jgi:hypothetical protein
MASRVVTSPFRKSDPSRASTIESVVSSVSPPLAAFGRSTSIDGFTM